MIESNFGNQSAAAQRQAQGQDIRTQQAQKESNKQAVEEQASSQPVASSGAAAVNTVASQPSDVVTRLGETTEEVPLYDSQRPSGTIIRPSIELAQNQNTQTAQAEQTAAERSESEASLVERNTERQTERQADAGNSPAQGDDPSPDDVQDMV